MKYLFFFLLGLCIVSCTSNSIYDKPENIIPKDTMELLLFDMYIANAAKNMKDKSSKKRKNYLPLVYEKYKIDSTRFDDSNIYYTSKIEDYNDILSSVKNRLENNHTIFKTEIDLKDSLKKAKKLKQRKLKSALKKAKISSVPFMLEKVENTPFYTDLNVYQSYIKEYNHILIDEDKVELINNKTLKNKKKNKIDTSLKSKE